MKRTIAAWVLFIGVIAVSLVNISVLKNATKELDEMIGKCEESVSSNSTDGGGVAEKALEELHECWESYSETAAFITRSEVLDDMAESVMVTDRLYRTDKEACLSELSSLRRRADLLLDGQLPHLSSIL